MALKFEQHVVHQEAEDYTSVIHLRLFGTNEEIGFKLGEIAKSIHSISRIRNADSLKNKCQKKYIKGNYPIHYNRMKGLARAYSENIETTDHDFTCFGNPFNLNACSAVFYPPDFTESGTGILSRNADLPTKLSSEMPTSLVNNNVSASKRFYIVELYPDHGIPSLINLNFELYGLGLDGINSEGLTVVHLHNDSIHSDLYRPTKSYGVGINEMLAVQLLLDNCKTVDEAKELLLHNKHFYMLVPTHFLVADRFGESFVWEYSHHHNQEFIINGNSEIQIITNFPLHAFQNQNSFPFNVDKSCPFERYKTLKKAIEEAQTISNAKIKEINSRVFIGDEMYEFQPQIRVRTIYHNLYDIHQKSMEISFFRKDEGSRQLRTEYFKFQLA